MLVKAIGQATSFWNPPALPSEPTKAISDAISVLELKAGNRNGKKNQKVMLGHIFELRFPDDVRRIHVYFGYLQGLATSCRFED